MHNEKLFKWHYVIIGLVFLTFSIFIDQQPVSASHETEVDLEQLEKYIVDIIQWKKQDIGKEDSPLFNHKFLEQAGESSVDWYVFGLGRAGISDDYDAYLAIIKDEIERMYQSKRKLSRLKATEWHRIALAILSIGGDPTYIETNVQKKPIDLIADGVYQRGKTTRSLGAQGINGWIWGLITLDSLRYAVPDDANVTREKIITEIMRAQLPDGGFALQTDTQFEVDMTAMAIQALAPYYNDEKSYTYEQIAAEKKVTKTVREVVDEALDCLSEAQLEDGDFALMDIANAESTAQVIVALTALGIDPLRDERFIKNDQTLLDGLLKYRKSDGGFIHSEMYDDDNPTAQPDESNPMASEQALYTLVALYRHYEGYRTLHDFRKEMDDDLKENIEKVTDAIEKLPDDPKEAERNQVKDIFDQYLNIPIEERSYVYNYSKLAKVMDELDVENTSEFIVEHMDVHKEGEGFVTPLFHRERYESLDHSLTEEDLNEVKQLLQKAPTTEDYVDVVTWIERMKRDQIKATHQSTFHELKRRKEDIKQLEKHIDQMNETILEELVPLDQVSLKDREIVDEIFDRYEKLNTYDQAKVQGYEDLKRAQAKIDSLIRERYFKGAMVIAIIVMAIFLMKRYQKRKRQKWSA